MSFLHTFVLLLDFLWPRSAMACAGLLAAFPPVLTWVNHVNNLVGTRGYGGGGGMGLSSMVRLLSMRVSSLSFPGIRILVPSR